MISYLASASRLDILFAIHQSARFCSCTKKSHEEAIKRIGCYLKKTKDKGIIYTFNETKGIEIYADANFAGS